jgi:hypothetical protein
MDCHCDIYVWNFNCHSFAVLSCYICALFWRHPIQEAAKIGIIYKKNQYIP